MVNKLAAFEYIAPCLGHPLLPLGFALLLIFFLLKLISEVGSNTKTVKQKSQTFKFFLRYGLILSVLTMLLDFCWQLYQSHWKTAKTTLLSTPQINQIVTTLNRGQPANSQLTSEQITALTEAVTDLSAGKDTVASEATIKAALNALAKGDATKAKTLLAKNAQKPGEDPKQKAKTYRDLGALAFFNDTIEALQAYRNATKLDPDNTEGWNQLGRLLERVGDLDGAFTAYSKIEGLAETHHNQKETATAYRNLGNVNLIHGDLEKAADYYQKALVANEQLDNKEDISANYGNLGLVYQARGELDKAIEYHEKALKIDENLDDKEGMAADYSNLGVAYNSRGDLEKATEYFQKSLALEENLGNKEGMAADYGNLGVIFNTRGEWDKALEYLQKSLALEEDLGHKEGMANDYTNLGNVYQNRGELDKAFEYYQNALALDESLGDIEGMAINYGNMGNIYTKQGRKEQADLTYQKGIELKNASSNKSAFWFFRR